MAQDKIVTKQRYRSELEMALRMVSKTIDDLKTYDIAQEISNAVLLLLKT